MSDPFTLVYDATWACAQEHPSFDSLIAAGNRVKFDDRSPYHDRYRAADVPELALTSEGGSYNLRASSSSTQVTRRYDWVLTTGDMRLSVLNPLSWMLLQSMTRLFAQLRALTWEGEQFVTRCQTLSARDGESEAARLANIRGWTSVQSFEIDMHFSTTELINGATP